MSKEGRAISSSVPQAWVYEGSPFKFVTDGLESALEQAQAVAGDKDIGVGAASIVQQCIRAGLDDIHIDLVPVLLGGGVSIVQPPRHGADRPGAHEGDRGRGVTHLTFRVLKWTRPGSGRHLAVQAPSCRRRPGSEGKET
jgi:hypothetical protein